MSPEKEVSKRQIRREQMRRREQRRRVITIGLIILGALLIVAPIAYQMLRPMAEVVSAAPKTYPNAEDNVIGDPNAPITIEQFADFQCPFCEQFFKQTEPLLIQY